MTSGQQQRGWSGACRRACEAACSSHPSPPCHVCTGNALLKAPRSLVATPHAHFALLRAQKQWDVFTSRAMHHAACQFRTRSRERRRSRRRAPRPGSCRAMVPTLAPSRMPRTLLERNARIGSFLSGQLSCPRITFAFDSLLELETSSCCCATTYDGNSSSFHSLSIRFLTYRL